MIIYTDSEGRIKDVETTTNPSLIKQEIDDESNPFKGWSKARICCYKVQVAYGQVIMMTPYVDSRSIDAVEQLGKRIETVTPYKQTQTAYILDDEVIFENVPKGNLTVYMEDDEGNYPDYTVERMQDRIIVHFKPLEYVTEVTISII